MNELTPTLVLFLVFLASALFVYSSYLLLRGSRDSNAENLQRRIQGTFSQGPLHSTQTSNELSNVSLAREEVDSALTQSVLGRPRINQLQRFLEQSGVELKPSAAIALSAFAGLVAMLLVMLLSGSENLFNMLLGLLVGAAMPWIVLRHKREKRRERMVEQLPDAMDYFARSMRAGHPFASALKSAADEITPPLSAEFEITFDELNYGLDFDEAMNNLAKRVGCKEVGFFVTAVLVQKSTGGNLAELMNRLANLMRERVRTRGEVNIQAADMRSSARILIFLPFAVAGFIHLGNPEYLPVLLESRMGHFVLLAQAVLMTLGYIIIQRMINFRI